MTGGPGWLIAPLSLVFFALLVVLLRWTFTSGKSLVAKRATPGPVNDYGLLVPIATPSTYIEGEITRRTLEDAGIRATLTTTLDGPRVMVFAAEEDRARALLP